MVTTKFREIYFSSIFFQNFFLLRPQVDIYRNCDAADATVAIRGFARLAAAASGKNEKILGGKKVQNCEN